MKSLLIGGLVIVSLSVAYILLFRINNRGKKPNGCGCGCGGCSGCGGDETNR